MIKSLTSLLLTLLMAVTVNAQPMKAPISSLWTPPGPSLLGEDPSCIPVSEGLSCPGIAPTGKIILRLSDAAQHDEWAYEYGISICCTGNTLDGNTGWVELKPKDAYRQWDQYQSGVSVYYSWDLPIGVSPYATFGWACLHENVLSINPEDPRCASTIVVQFGYFNAQPMPEPSGIFMLWIGLLFIVALSWKGKPNGKA